MKNLVAAVLTDFFEGGIAYNAVALGTALVAIALGAIALWIAVFQLRRIRHAAEAAQIAASEARTQITTVTAVSSLSALYGLSQELLTHLRQDSLDAALLRAMDLRGALARARVSSRDTGIPSQKDWQTLVTKVTSVQGALEKRSIDGSTDRSSTKRCLKIMNDVHERLSEFASEVEARAGDHQWLSQKS